jgi:hypothetical protein
MISQQVIWDGYLSLTMPLGWDWAQDDGVISIYDPTGVGVLQISFAASHVEPWAIEPLELTKSFAEAQGVEHVRPDRMILDGLPAGYFEGITKGNDPSLWRIWSVGRNGRIVTVSYTCSEEDRDFERSHVDKLIRSMRWLF